MASIDVLARFEAALGSEFEFDQREATLLVLAQQMADRLGQLQAELDVTGLWIDGSTGQRRLNPLVSEIRLQQSALGRVLEGVRLPVESGDGEKSPRHQRSARMRWERTRGQGDGGS